MMTANREIVYWKSDPSWYVGNHMNPRKVKLTDKAPERARKSFEVWQKLAAGHHK